jgi:hypothetical protein
MKISLLANTKSPNPGNWALIAGTKWIIERSFGGNLEFEMISWDDITFKDSVFGDNFYEKVNNSDLLWIVGAVTFNGREEHTRGGCRFNLNSSDLDRIRVPIVFGGVSYRFWNTHAYPNSQQLRNLLTSLSCREKCLVGVRNDGTREWIRDIIGISSNAIVEFPDPGLFAVKPRKIDEKEIQGIVVSLNNEDSDSRFKSEKERENLILSIANACKSFWEIHDEYVSFAPHSFEDYELFGELTKLLPKKFLHQRVNVFPIAPSNETKHFYELYAKARAVIATRVHAMSPSIGMQIPTLVVSSQDRLRNYMKNLELQDYFIEQGLLDSNSSAISSRLIGILDSQVSIQSNFREARESQIEALVKPMNRVKTFFDEV